MKYAIMLLAAMLSLKQNTSAQGCSDAGVCTSGGLRPHDNIDDTMPRGSAAITIIAGAGEQGVFIVTPQLELTSRLTKNNSVQLKLPYTFTSGNLGSTSGLGDVVITDIQRLGKGINWKFTLNIGVKLAMNTANKPAGDKPLPMPYQTSLGTHDVLLGFSALYKSSWFAALGFQAPFFQNNENGFDAAHPLWAGNADAGQYFSSNLLNRRPDITLRIEKLFKIKRSVLYAGVLPIYHLGHDRYTNLQSTEMVISGSKGLTLNLTGAYALHLTDKLELNFRAAAPVIVRKVRPDGLTRHWVTALMLMYSF